LFLSLVSLFGFYRGKAKNSDQSDYLIAIFFGDACARRKRKNFAPRCKKDCSTAHEQDLLSRRPEGEELRAAGAKGGKNRRRASARRELQDVAGLICLGLIYLGYKEIARAVKGQAPRCS
jgi:hypothetical protein